MPLFAYMLWLAGNLLLDADYQPLLKGLDLGIHELGHMVFAPLGQFMTIAGGSLLQCLVPLVGAAMFARQRDLFAIAFAAVWLGVNLHDVGTYASDARAMELPLVSPFAGDEIIHDWNWLLEHLGMLERDQMVGRTFHGLGHLSLGAGIGFGGWVLWRMAKTSR